MRRFREILGISNHQGGLVTLVTTSRGISNFGATRGISKIEATRGISKIEATRGISSIELRYSTGLYSIQANAEVLIISWSEVPFLKEFWTFKTAGCAIDNTSEDIEGTGWLGGQHFYAVGFFTREQGFPS